MAPYRAAVIGCGRISRMHFRSYQEAGIPIVAAADISQEALEGAKTQYGVERTYTDYTQMLDEVGPELVSICTHDALHCPMTVAAAERGVKGIICEKPMAMDLDEADRMLGACRASGSVLTISHQRYYTPQYVAARRLIEEGAIGALRGGETMAHSACIQTDGTHTIHMLLTLLGWPRVRYLLAQVDSQWGVEYFGYPREGGGIAFLHFENGLHGHMTWGFAERGKERSDDVRLHPKWNFTDYLYHAFTIRGTEGHLELSGDIRGEELSPERSYLRLVRGRKAEEMPFQWPPVPGPVTLEIQDVIESIEQGTPHPLRGETGRDVLEVVIGIYEAARRRAVQKLPIEVHGNPLQEMIAAGTFAGI
jgi:predicted dehydrogenase